MSPVASWIPQLLAFIDPLRTCFTAQGWLYFQFAFMGLLLSLHRPSLSQMAHITGFAHKARGLTAFFSKGHWRLSLMRFELLRLTTKLLPVTTDAHGKRVCLLGTDDSLVHKPKAPRMAGICRLFNHSPRPGRQPGFIKGHCWLFVAFIARPSGLARYLAFPLAARLWRRACYLTEGETYLGLGQMVLQEVKPWMGLLKEQYDHTVLLCDAYFSKVPFMLDAIALGLEIISRLRCDRTLYELPGPRPTGKRGRPRKYGDRIDFEALLNEPRQVRTWTVWLYGKMRKVEGVHRICRLKVAQMEFDISLVAMWSKADGKGRRKLILLFSSNVERGPEEIIGWYGARWSLELAIRDMKQGLGLSAYQMRALESIMRYVQTVCVVQTLVQLAYVQGIFGAPNASFSMPGLRRRLLLDMMGHTHFSSIPLEPNTTNNPPPDSLPKAA